MSRRTLRLVAGAKTVAQTVEAASRAFERELARVYRDLTAQLGPLLEQAARGSRTGLIQAAQAAQVRRELGAALEAAGFRTLADAGTSDPLDAVARDVLKNRRLAGASATLSRGVRLRLEALKALQLEDLLDEGQEVARALYQATVRGVFNSRPAAQILADLSAVLDDTAPHLATFYDTSVSIYGRQVEALQAGDAPETTFAYMGPADSRTRPFCLRHVGKVYTRETIDALDNGQLDNVFLTGGGYNCRHVFVEVSQASELQDLVGTSGRVPEVQDQLDGLEEAA